MGNNNKLVNALLVTGAVVVGLYFFSNMDPGLPDDYRFGSHYWGSQPWTPGQPVPKDDESIRDFSISVPDSVLTDVKARLKNARLPAPSMSGTGFSYGFNTKALKQVIDYWANKYDWKKHEKELNSFPHFKTQIEGLDIHFIHVKAKTPAKDIKPIILVHGWGSSVYDYLKVIPLLTSNSSVAFDVVIPSLPGHGWTQASERPGLNVIHIARIYSKLMTRLGYQFYIISGGDWGQPIGKASAVLYPERIIGKCLVPDELLSGYVSKMYKDAVTNDGASKLDTGFHATMPTAKVTLYSCVKVFFGMIFPGHVYDNSEKDVPKVHPIFDKLGFLFQETGYFHVQATKPDTIGAALSDSPVGLAAWLLERYAIFTNPDNINKDDISGLTETFSMDQLLTNVMIYWVTNTASTSARIFKESASYHVLYDLHFEK